MKENQITKKYYNKYAKDYHKRISEKSNIWHKYVEKPAMIKFLNVKNKKVLDLGCGSGIFSKKILSLGAKKVIGIDFSDNLIKIAKKEYPEINFYVGNALKMPCKKSEFDVVSSSLMAHYIQDLDKLFKEVSRILKKKGEFVFSMQHPVMEVVKRIKKGDKQLKLRKFENYFHNNKYILSIKSGDQILKLVAYHHTFEMIFNSLNKNGFIVENLIETKAPLKTKKINKRVYDKSNQVPTFLVIKSRKIK